MTGKGKARKDIQKGIDESTEFTNRAIARVDPFAKTGQAATDIIGQAVGVGGSGTVLDRFNASPFAAVFDTNFNRDKDAIDAGLSNQGLAFSGARLAAVEDARAKNFSSAFQNYLRSLQGLSNQGFGAVVNQSGALQQQGVNNLNARTNQATTRQGFLGGISQFGNALESLGEGFTSFFPDSGD